MDNRIKCIPLDVESSRIAQELLHKFSKAHSLKRSFRNSISDLLILATTLHKSAQFLTRDSCLARFAEKEGLVTRQPVAGWVKLSSCYGIEDATHRNRESKGYINRSWQVRLAQPVAAFIRV